MITLDGYTIKDTIHRDLNSRLFRAVRDTDSLPVILKLPASDYPGAEDIARIRYEYEIMRDLKSEAVLKVHELFLYRNFPVMVIEDFGGVPLSDSPALELRPFLNMALQIASALVSIHEQGVIHKDIKPHNCFIHPVSGRVKLGDFSISSRLTRESGNVAPELEGSLPYISPEQTGRMNRAVDLRSDFYSLGATYYHCLTGRPPFTATDSLELIHCHIARNPTPLSRVRPDLPGVVSAIVEKLMAKTAEERYQSAFGLYADLENCLKQLDIDGKIRTFSPGRDDLSNRFQLPQILYGREAELEQLETVFARAKKGERGLLLVSGPPGVGKTVLIQEVNRPLAALRGSFISGKYEQFKHDVPYLGLLQAMRELLRKILSEPETSVAAWRERFRDALGGQDGAIPDMRAIPELKLILGPSFKVQPDDSFSARHRFNEAFLALVRSLCRPDHPLVLFLDDLQWADEASLSFLDKLLRDGDTNHLLVIGSYRDNEVDPDAALSEIINKLKNDQGESGAYVDEIRLAPLSRTGVLHFAADAVRRGPDDPAVRQLAEIAHTKTLGNPFFLGEFLKGMQADGILRYADGAWTWEPDEVGARAMTENVVDFVASRLRLLSPETKDTLKVAATVGNRFDLHTLAVARECSPARAAGSLWEALSAGLVQPLNESYKYVEFQDPNPRKNSETSLSEYRFLHDRVQQAAYSLLGDGEKRELHWRIGRHLFEEIAGPDDARIIDIANHLNAGKPSSLAATPSLELARINQRAGRRAWASAAFFQSARYFEYALAALPGDGWRNHRELTHAVHVQAAEAMYLAGESERADELAAKVLAESKDVLERVPIYVTRIQLYTANIKLHEAVDSGLEILSELGVRPPDDPQMAAILAGFARTKFALRGRKPETLPDLPAMTDVRALATMEVISKTLTPIMIARPRLMPLMVFAMVRLSVRYGNCPASAYAYAMFGLILSGPIGDIEGGYRMGNAARALKDRLQAPELDGQIGLVYNLFIRHWKEHGRESVAPLLLAARRNYDSGNLILASFSLANYAIYRFWATGSLEEQKADLDRLRRRLVSYGSATTLPYFDILAQAVLNLTERGGDPCEFNGDSFQAERDLPLLVEEDNKGAVGFYYSTRIMISVMFGRSSAALEDIREFAAYAEMLAGFMVLPRTSFFSALHFLAEAGRSGGRRYRRYAAVELRRLKKWARHSPENNLHRVLLLQAEFAALRRKDVLAGNLYEQAAAAVEREDHVFEAALVNELAAEFYISRGHEKIARAYWMDARYGYARWGAAAKVEQMDDLRPGFVPHQTPAGDESAADTLSSTGGAKVPLGLDLTTILRGAQAISEEIRLDRLLDRMLRLLIENAGADRGVFLLLRNGELFIEASRAGEFDPMEVLQHIPLDDPRAARELPLSVIQFVARARENIVLSDAVGDAGSFADEEYFRERGARSILCMPVLRGARLTGILFLENRLAVGAFTEDRVQLMAFLSSQIAISVENAVHYGDLEARIMERTQELARAHARLLDLQKQATERQMAGGFAHEMRNALAGAQLMLDQALGHGDPDEESTMNVMNARRLRAVAGQIRDKLAPEEFQETLLHLQEVLSDMERLDDMLNLVRRATMRGLSITSQIMDYSRIGSEERGDESIDIVELLESLLAEHGHVFEDSAIETSLDVRQRPVTSGRRNHYYSIFFNLIDNAANALRKTRESSRLIAIRVELEGRRALVRIRDNAAGIAPEHLDRIFEPFFSTSPESGTGLGLNEVNKTLSLYGGEVQVRTPVEGSGTEFCVYFPAELSTTNTNDAHDVSSGSSRAQDSTDEILEAL